MVFHVKHHPLLLVYPEAEAKLTEYVRWLSTAGIERGLMGPREADRMWERHIANCAAVADLIPQGDSVCDVGSGAGLPGLVLAIVRPDLKVTLIEPLQRRCDFLNEVIADLDLPVKVLRGRAQEFKGHTFKTVTSRAVAPLGKLLTWCAPLTSQGGQIVAMKGSSALQEIQDASAEIGHRSVDVVECGTAFVEPPTTVVRVHF